MPTRTLQIVLAGDPASASRAFKKVGDDAERMGKRVDHEGGRIRGFATITSKGFGRVGVAAGGMAVAGAGAAALLAKSFVSGATSINESLTKNEVLFGKHADAVDRFSQRTAENLGISRQAALEATGTFGNLFVALEIGPKKSAGMSVALTKLAGDLASFNNASPDEALEAIRSGLVGETEPLRRFGVNLNDATLRTEALRMGLIKNTKEALDPQTKALAVNSLLFKQTEKAQGDFARTSGGLANQQRILKARLADLGAEIGGKLMPVVLRAVRVVNSALTGDWAKAWKGAKSIASDALKGLGSVVRDLWGVVGPALLSFGKFLVRKLKEGVSATPDVVFAAIQEIPPVVHRGYQVVGPSMESFGEFLMRNFRQGVRAMPGIVRAAIHDIPPVIKRGWEVAGPAMVSFGVFLRRKLVSGLDRLGDALREKIKGEIRHALRNPEDLIPSIRIGKTIFDKVMGPAGDGLGKQIGAAALGFMGGSAGASGAGLMGADFDLAPFARIGASAGLRTTSGLRPGSVTSSGNVSYHSTGDAIDMGGSMGGMRRAATVIRNLFGSRIRELISPFPELGIKDGRPFRYSGQIQAQHSGSNAHVHVAYTGPFGDGVGRAASKPPPIGDKTMDWMQSVWGRIAPMLGQSPATKVRDLFKYTEGKGLFVGVDAINPKKGKFGLLWPKWLGKPDKALTQLFIHEMAHRFQKPGATGSYRLAEGGAEAFARRVMAAQFGGPVPSTTYAGIADWVTKHKGENWINYGQFGRKPGTGDGLGRFSSTAYGPPWGGIQGTGVTATGVNLKGSPHRYGVAVDPSVIPLGTRLKIKPNPFNYSGYFTAFDTGGAIKGNRIDFYDWRGRASQMQWGSRSVTVWTENEAPTVAERRSGRAPGRAPSPATQLVGRAGRGRGGLGTGSKYVMGPNGFPVLRSSLVPFQSGPAKGRQPDDWYLPAAEATEAASDPAAEALTAAIEASTKATEEHTAALNTVGSEMKRQTDLAQQYASTSEFQKTKFLADIFSGQFGRGIIGRGFTAGTGVEVAW